MGMRWEPVIPHSDPAGRISYMDINAPNAAAGNIPGAIHYGGSPGNGNRYLNMLWNNYAPRIGLAYRLTDRTVVRGGFGIFNSNYINQSLGLPAFGYSTTASFTSADNGTTPAFNWDNGFPQNFRRPPVIDPTAANRQGQRGLAGSISPTVQAAVELPDRASVCVRPVHELRLRRQCRPSPVCVAEPEPTAAAV